MKILLLGVNYAQEGMQHGEGALNGFTAYSEMLARELARFGELYVATDRPERYPGVHAINVFREKRNDLSNIEEFWRHEFRIYGMGEEKQFSRDTIYRLIQLTNTLDPVRLEKVISELAFDCVALNRHEYFFLANLPIIKSKKLIFVAHDALYLRRLAYEKYTDMRQPLSSVEMLLENALLKDATTIISIAPEECAYFKTITNSDNVFLFRPEIFKPKEFKRINEESLINCYFLGVNNFVNRLSLQRAIDLIKDISSRRNIIFHIFGSVSHSIEDTNQNNNIICHGHVDNLEKALENMHILIAPIQTGSGAPIKISDALSSGHFVVTTRLGAASYSEFEGEHLFVSDDLEDVIDHMLSAPPRTFAAYDKYIAANHESMNQLFG